MNQTFALATDRQQHTITMASTMESCTASSRTNPANNKGQILLSELGPHDVLLGRGTGPNENMGNIRFREILKETMVACQRDNSVPAASMKSWIVYGVLARVKALNGYFVRKLTRDEIRKCSLLSGSVPKNTCKDGKKQTFRFVVVSDPVAADKTKQSIRFQLTKVRNGDPITSTKTSTTKTKDAISAVVRSRHGGCGKISTDLRLHVYDPSLSLTRGEAPRDPVLSHDGSDGTKGKSFFDSYSSSSTSSTQLSASRTCSVIMKVLAGERLFLRASLLSTSTPPTRTTAVENMAASILAAAPGGSSASALDLLRASASNHSSLLSSSTATDPLGLLTARQQQMTQDREQRYSLLQAAVLANAQQEQRNQAASLMSALSLSLENGTGGW
jgi:hypothetical protein